MNHRINYYLRSLPPRYLNHSSMIPERVYSRRMPKFWGGDLAYWGIIKLAFPVKCRGLVFCLEHEEKKYDNYEPYD